MEKVWLSQYPAGIPAEIKVDPSDSLVKLIDDASKKYATEKAFVNFGEELTYAEVDRLSRDFAAYLQHYCKLQRGDRVAVMLPNLLQYPIAVLGILRAGLVVVNINPVYTAHELEHLLSDSTAKAIVIWSNAGAALQKVIAKSDIKHVILTTVGEMLSFPKGFVFDFVLKYLKKQIPAFSLPGAIYFKKTLEKGAKIPLQQLDITAQDTAFLQYTGGTTGLAKGAILSHGNMLANIYQASAWVGDEFGPGQGDVIITALPMYHIFSLTANLLLFYHFGALNLLITNPRDIKGFVKQIKPYAFTAITGVNTLYNALANEAAFAQCDFSRLKLALGGGMAVQRAVAEHWKKVTGTPLVEAYGLTEASPAVTVNRLDAKEFTGTIGLPLPSTDVKVVDDQGNELSFNEPGELYVRGPQVMQGYWHREDETKLALTQDSWLHTGDVATIDEQGYVRIVDRKKDMILVSGFNVYPNEIEDVVASLPGVLEVAAIGVPDEHSGETVKLFVVKKDPTLTEEEVRDYCKEYLTGYKRPKYIEFRDQLPKTNVGKILRRSLREEQPSIHTE